MLGLSYAAELEVNTMQRVAVIGLGVMGGPMASWLVQSGYEVMGIDAAPQARDNFSGALSPAEADLSQVEVIITMLPEGPHVQGVYEDFIVPNAKPGSLLIDCSTIDVKTAKSINTLALDNGFVQIDAPVSGGCAAAGSGQLSFMLGGQTEHVELAKSILETLGQKRVHFGDASAGQAAKACHNMICGITAMAVLEGFALADSLGLDNQQFYQLCQSAAAQSWTLENRCPIPGVVPEAPASNAYAPGFAARLMAKDLRLAQAAAQTSGQATPFGAQAAEAFTAFAEETGGQLDFSSYYTKLRSSSKQQKDS